MKMILKLTRDHETGCKHKAGLEDPVLKDEEKLAYQEGPGTSGEEQVDLTDARTTSEPF